jgi:hypothetical protein
MLKVKDLNAELDLEISEQSPLPSIDSIVNSPPESCERGPGLSSPGSQVTAPSTLRGNRSPPATYQLQGDCSTTPISNGPINDCEMAFTNSLKLMEDKVDRLEKKIPFLEEALGCVLKLIASTETVKQTAEGIPASQTPSITSFGFNATSETSIIPTSSPKAQRLHSCLSPGKGTSIQNTESHSDMPTCQMLEGATMTSEFEKAMDDILQRDTLPSSWEMADFLEKTNNSFLNKGYNKDTEPMDLLNQDLDCVLVNEKHPMELLVDV